jgi:hypothetical protein
MSLCLVLSVVIATTFCFLLVFSTLNAYVCVSFGAVIDIIERREEILFLIVSKKNALSG